METVLISCLSSAVLGLLVYVLKLRSGVLKELKGSIKEIKTDFHNVVLTIEQSTHDTYLKTTEMIRNLDDKYENRFLQMQKDFISVQSFDRFVQQISRGKERYNEYN